MTKLAGFKSTTVAYKGGADVVKALWLADTAKQFNLE
jgi:hypothetical protein